MFVDFSETKNLSSLAPWCTSVVSKPALIQRRAPAGRRFTDSEPVADGDRIKPRGVSPGWAATAVCSDTLVRPHTRAGSNNLDLTPRSRMML